LDVEKVEPLLKAKSAQVDELKRQKDVLDKDKRTLSAKNNDL